MSKQRVTIKSTLPQRLREEARHHGYETLLLRTNLVVGVSGGADSLALLHALCDLRGADASSTLHVAHLEHGFRGEESKADAEFVAQIATAYGLRHTVRSIAVPALAQKYRLSLEDTARRARYTFLAELAQEQDATVTVAHTADDQAETVLMSILRGAGLAGLAGMQTMTDLRFNLIGEAAIEGEQARLAVVRLFRPMLSVWREEVERYCLQYGLEPRTDSTNSETVYLRNRIRLDLLPYIQAHYSPAINEHLHSLAEIASGDDGLLEGCVDGVWEEVVSKELDNNAVRIDTARFSKLHIAMQRRITRRAIASVAGTLDGITFGHIGKVVSTLVGEPASAIRLHLPHDVVVERVASTGVIARRKAYEGWVKSQVPNSREWPLMQPELEIALNAGESVDLEGGWLVASSIVSVGELVSVPGELEAHFDIVALGGIEHLVMRTRRPGDLIQPLGMSGRKSLQDLYVDAKIPSTLRDHIPVLLLAGVTQREVLWVPGPRGRRSSFAPVGPETTHVLRVVFQRKT